MDRREGKVKWFDPAKGYGFIISGDEEIFVHWKAIMSDGYKTLDDEENVSFEVVEGKKGPQAANVIRKGGGKKRERKRDNQ